MTRGTRYKLCMGHKFVVTQQRVHGGGLYRVIVGLWTTKPDLKGGKKPLREALLRAQPIPFTHFVPQGENFEKVN